VFASSKLVWSIFFAGVRLAQLWRSFDFMTACVCVSTAPMRTNCAMIIWAATRYNIPPHTMEGGVHITHIRLRAFPGARYLVLPNCGPVLTYTSVRTNKILLPTSAQIGDLYLLGYQVNFNDSCFYLIFLTWHRKKSLF
jgi:hypothetical protein